MNMQTDAELLDLINKTVSGSPGEVEWDKETLTNVNQDLHDAQKTTETKDAVMKDIPIKTEQTTTECLSSETDSSKILASNISIPIKTDQTATECLSSETDSSKTQASSISNIKEEPPDEVTSMKDNDMCSLENLTKTELIEELQNTRKTLDETKKSLARMERQLEKSDNYNGVLRNMVEQLSSEIHRYKNTKTQSLHVQVDVEDLLNFTIGEYIMPSWDSKPTSVAMETENQEVPVTDNQSEQALQEVTGEEPVSVADSIKATAEAVVQKQTDEALTDSGYVFDQQSGLYYHQESGYYYNSEKGLYYDPSSGTYFFYNYETGTYEFHSQINPADYNAGSTQASTQDSGAPKAAAVKKKRKKKPKKDEGKIFKNRKERRRAKFERKEKKKRKKTRHRHSKRKHKRQDKDSSGEESEWDSDLERVVHRSKHRHRKKRRRHSDCKKVFLNSNELIVLDEVSDSDINDSPSEDKKGIDREVNKKDKDNEAHELMSIDEIEPEKNVNGNVGKDKDVKAEDELTDNIEGGIHNVESEKTEDLWAESFSNGQSEKMTLKDESNEDGYEKADLEDLYDVKAEVKAQEEKVECSGEDKVNCAELDKADSIRKDKADCIVVTSGSEMESGQLSESSHSSFSASSFSSDTDDSSDSADTETSEEDMEDDSDNEDVAGSWPPCIRAIVTESDCVEVGMLYLVTCAGATVGREGDRHHDIPLRDINVSKLHAEVQYNPTDKQYEIIDKGSQNGTFVNEERISKPKETSAARGISHGDSVQIGVTKLLCHIHPGSDTCDDCEPGIAMAKHKATLPLNEVKILSAEDKKKLHRDGVKELKKKFGLKNADYVENKGLYNNPSYADRAEERRVTVGSDVPGLKQTSAPASVHKPITSENKGHKMMQKMGWKEGDSLGKSNSGIQEPISVTLRANQAAGLGSASAGAYSADDANTVDLRKASRRAQAQQRYNRITGDTADTGGTGDTAAGIKKSGTAKSGGLKWTKGETEYS